MRCGSSQAVALYLLAFFSGTAALAYEVAWTKWLSLSFGSSVLAASTTVAAFMGGMGVGAWAYHRVQRRISSPLRLYAILELGIALSAVGLTLLLERLPPLFAFLLSVLPDAATDLVRILVTLAVLALPTALMGATYPALCSVAISDRNSVDRHLGALYGWNTVGAAAGGLLAGILLIPALGLNAAVAFGVATNLVVAAAALGIDLRGRSTTMPAPHEATLPSRLPRFVTATVLFVSGLVTLAYEIVWFRVFRPIAGNSTFAFTIVLVTFLVGLGFGAMALRRVLARGEGERVLALVQMGIGLTAAGGIAALTHFLSTPTGMTFAILHPDMVYMSWPARLWTHGGLALATMLPATLLMGLSFPLASRLYLDDVTRIGQRVGSAVLLANLGSIAGSIGAATLLLPTLGSMGSTRLLAGTNILLALLVARYVPGSLGEKLRWTGPGLLGASIVVALIPASVPYLSHHPHMTSPMGDLRSRVVFEEEGELATVRVDESIKYPSMRGMGIDGTTIGVSAGWRYHIYSKQLLLAHLPMWLEPRLRSVLQIGLGSASTLDALTGYPALDRITSVEINPAVVRGAELFEESRAFQDPRVEVHVEDAIHYLLSPGEDFDLIVADGKQNSDFSGNAKLLSQEFYQLASDRLTEHGLFVQWISTSVLPRDYRVILRTAASVFPHLEVFFEIPSSTLIVGSREPLRGRARSGVGEAPVEVLESLRQIDIAGPDLLGLGWIADREALISVVGDGPVNCWSSSVIEFSAYRATQAELRSNSDVENLDLLLEANARAIDHAPEDLVASSPAQREAHRLIRIAFRELARGSRASALSALEEAESLAPEDPIVRRALRWSAKPRP